MRDEIERTASPHTEVAAAAMRVKMPPLGVTAGGEWKTIGMSIDGAKGRDGWAVGTTAAEGEKWVAVVGMGATAAKEEASDGTRRPRQQTVAT